jgi:hypothetical protein
MREGIGQQGMDGRVQSAGSAPDRHIAERARATSRQALRRLL